MILLVFHFYDIWKNQIQGGYGLPMIDDMEELYEKVSNTKESVRLALKKGKGINAKHVCYTENIDMKVELVEE